MKANRIRKPVAKAARSAGLARWTRKLVSGELPLMSIWRIGGVLVLLVVYVALLERVGFVLLTAALMSVLFGAYAGIRWVWAIPLATGLAVANYALFKLALGTQLPAGILG